MKRIIVFLLALSITLGCTSLQIQKDDSIPMKLTKGLARVPLCLMTLFLSEAYYSTDRKVKSWLGHNVNDLIMSWGPPTQVYDDGEGGKFIVYTERQVYVSPGYSTTNTTGSAYGYVSGNNIYIDGHSQSHTTYYPPQVNQWTVYRMFRANRYGRIISYKWEGL